MTCALTVHEEPISKDNEMMRTFSLMAMMAGLIIISGCADTETVDTAEATSDTAAAHADHDHTASDSACCSEDGGTCCKDGEEGCCKDAGEASCCKDGEKGECCKETAKTEDGAAVSFVNENCPIMGSPVKAGGGSAEWNGKMVGFCCPGCIEKWDSLSDEAKQTKLTEASAAKEEAGA